MAARVTYRRAGADGKPTGNAVTLAVGATAEAAYRRDPRWLEVDRIDVDVPAEPERLKPAERAEARAAAVAATEAAASDPATIAAGNVGEVKAAVTAGGPELAAAVLEVERAGRNRESLVAWLLKRAGDVVVEPAPADEGDTSVEPAGKVGVEFADPAPEPDGEGDAGAEDGDTAADSTPTY